MVGRKGGWVQTYTGKQFWPLDPRPEDVDIHDIAHSLSMLCRFVGHSRYFYSVAQHSVHVAEQFEDSEIALAGLLHDASEAYLSDIARPIKGQLHGYKDIEKELQSVIAQKFGIEHPWPEQVKKVDSRLLVDEAIALMPNSPAEWDNPKEPLGIQITPWSQEGSKAAFLGIFNYLMIKRDYH